MNTPPHVIVNLALQTGGDRRGLARPVLAGALLPDLPMFAFFFWERFVVGSPAAVIWGESYFAPAWQDFFDVFNSIPLALVGLAIAWRLSRKAGVAFFASMLLHQALDLPLHHDDAHRHFFPLAEFRFESSVSYWDPRRHGALAALAETLALAVGAWVLARRYATRGARLCLALLVGLQTAGWIFFYGLGRLP